MSEDEHHIYVEMAYPGPGTTRDAGLLTLAVSDVDRQDESLTEAIAGGLVAENAAELAPAGTPSVTEIGDVDLQGIGRVVVTVGESGSQFRRADTGVLLDVGLAARTDAAEAVPPLPRRPAEVVVERPHGLGVPMCRQLINTGDRLAGTDHSPTRLETDSVL